MKLTINTTLIIFFSLNVTGQNIEKIDHNLLEQLKKDFFYCESYDTSRCLAQLFVERKKETNKYIVKKVKLVPVPKLIDFPEINCNHAIVYFYLLDVESLKGVIELILIDDSGLVYDKYTVEWIKYNLFKKRKILSEINYNGMNLTISYFKTFMQKTKIHPYYTKTKYKKIIEIDTLKNVFFSKPSNGKYSLFGRGKGVKLFDSKN